VNVPSHDPSTETAKASFGNGDFLLDAASFTDCSGRFAARVYSMPSISEVFSRSHDAVIRVIDEAGNVIETHEHQGGFREAS
jgi:hypothetical protein